MSPDDFEFISEILKERSGLVLTTNKMYLLESRLLPVARNQGIDSIDDLVAEIRGLRRDLPRVMRDAVLMAV